MLDEIFKKIQAGATATNYVSARNPHILKLDPGKEEKGNNYLVRLLPYMKNPGAGTFVQFMNHGWESRKTGKYVTSPCLKTWGRNEKCPLCEVRFAELKIGTDAAKAKARLLKQKTTHFVNVYVINSPTSPEDNGKVKILRYGAELDKIISAAITGEDAAEFGKRVLDLSKNGLDLRISAKLKGVGKDAMPTYASSRFITTPNDLGLSPERIQEILDSAHDLLALVPERKSAEEIQKLLNDHYYTAADRPNNVTEYVTEEDDEDAPFESDEAAPPPTSTKKTKQTGKAVSNSDEEINNTVSDLLAEFSLPNA